MSTRKTIIPASAPTSPAVTRKTERHPPVTPQRASHSAQHRFSSPYTPATTLSTPYTPFSLRSLSSSSNGSNVATPASAVGRRRLSLTLSPEVHTNSKSLADIAENWRTRANENGIKVTSSDDSQYMADESSLDLSIPVIDKTLLPAPFLSTQRRARAFSHAHVPLSQIPDPTQVCTPGRALQRLPGILNTPPPQPAFRLRGSVTDPPQTRRHPAFAQTRDLFDIDEDEYVPYPSTFTSPLPNQTLPLVLNDLFSFQPNVSEPLQLYETPVFSAQPTDEEATPFACSICGSSGGSLAVLEPCTHPLCSACLTSALNIVGEKDMECAVCNSKVDNFQLHKPAPGATYDNGTATDTAHKLQERAYSDANTRKTDVDALQGSYDGHVEDVDGIDYFMDRAQGASTPVAGARSAHCVEPKHEEGVVLRIDNVPWDITPPAIAVWLKHPVERVHVLLDRKGKTLSHAYAEMASADAAKAALRSAQNSVLGRGKRARGVTVTKSSQEELMRALFPSWQGNFDGSRPSLSGLDNERVISTLQRGLFSEVELNCLLHLIRAPDSHFLKVPSLPFHSLISILSKFPADDDSRVFWSSTLRDMLYEITYTAVHILLVRINDDPMSDWAALMTQLVRAAMDCQAFTSEQMSQLSDALEAALPKSASSPASEAAASYSPALPNGPVQNYQEVTDRHSAQDSQAFGDLAAEFGVEPHLIEALARRLSGIC